MFFAYYLPNHPQATSEADLNALADAKTGFKANHSEPFTPMETISSLFNTAPLFQAETLTETDINRLFKGKQRHVEKQNGTVYSFFYGDGAYVSLKAKECILERGSGHITRSGIHMGPSDDTLSSAHYAFGLFHAQTTIGNTAFNKMLSVLRHPLNAVKSSGQRIFVKQNGQYTLLGLPSAFEMGIHYCRWIYKHGENTLIITVWTDPDKPGSFLDIKSEGTPFSFLISHHIFSAYG